MDLMQFHRMRTAIQDNASPGPEQELVTVEGSLRYMLLTSGLFEEVEVEHTDDPDQLVIALCQFKPEVAAADVARRLEEIWADRVSYSFWEAHATDVMSDHVEFEAATRPSTVGGYVTVHLVAQRAVIPAQRSAHDAADNRQSSLS
ncbi:hypothetical protein [Nocardioides iriomotensis]|uniref:Uncharacterized protein n=1 Tax=Nocardioides iriomotensis TaxID=715784 RepID=A0A4Q5J6P8_9ACTN|nr:hypothetical protein [Nocardioides iriomotensis]RYU14163.1 hypothetical protein ETU37_04460 [Nocardioides iriomotensis]